MRNGRVFYNPPRVFKTDIRRYLTSMWVNSINSFDIDKIRSFLEIYAVPNCEHLVYSVAAKSGKISKRNEVCCIGTKTIANNLDFAFKSCSDFTLQIQQVGIRRNSHYTGSIIESRLINTATIIVPMNHTEDSGDENNISSVTSDISESSTTSEESTDISLTHQTIELRLQHYSRIWLDEDNRIYRFTVHELNDDIPNNLL